MLKRTFKSILSWLLLPIYLPIGIWIRERSPRFGPAANPVSGQYGKGKPKVKLLVVGDSSAASVGIAQAKDGLASQVARWLHEDQNVAVSWKTSGHNSAIAGEVRDIIIPNLPEAEYTHIIMAIGTNDIKNLHTVSRWKKQFGGMIYALRARFPEAQIWWMPIMKMRDVPTIPAPLAFIMQLRTDLLNQKAIELCQERGVHLAPHLTGITPGRFL